MHLSMLLPLLAALFSLLLISGCGSEENKTSEESPRPDHLSASEIEEFHQQMEHRINDLQRRIQAYEEQAPAFKDEARAAWEQMVERLRQGHARALKLQYDLRQAEGQSWYETQAELEETVQSLEKVYQDADERIRRNMELSRDKDTNASEKLGPSSES